MTGSRFKVSSPPVGIVADADNDVDLDNNGFGSGLQ